MRIISGSFRGKKILQPLDNFTRPLKDLTKESIFNVIKHSNKFNIDLEKSYILDLFSGVGSFGLECISRGAQFVTFIENYKEVLPILKKNLNSLKSVNNYKILEKDILNDLNFISLNQKFDLIFLDPPYKDKNLLIILNKIIESKILSNNGVIIIHRHKKELNEFPKNLKIIEEKKYGISKIIFATI
jgi:16S rRNA (guanine966-N2)-methyltransferase